MSTILFWGHVHGSISYANSKRFVLLSVPVKMVAEGLGVYVHEIKSAFEEWAHYREMYARYEVEPKKWIEIVYAPESYVLDGVIRIVRPWGNHWRSLETPTYSWTEEISV